MNRRCAKRRFRDSVAAHLALAVIQRADNTSRPATECRVYHCPRCHCWHLTSKVAS